LTIQEAIIIQSFPENYLFGSSKTVSKEKIGNSVPPKFMEAIARNIKENILQ